MKRILAILALVSFVATGISQEITQSGVYTKCGKPVILDKEPLKLSVTLRVVVEEYIPGIYARFAQKYLAQRATLSPSSTIKIVGGSVSTSVVERVVPELEKVADELPLPLNVMSAEVADDESQAAATAEMVFSLRRHRLELITGEAGEHVFGAGLKDALAEITKMETTYLEMFYGKKTTREEVYVFVVDATPDKNEYVVCRFSDIEGVVDSGDLSGSPVVLKIETEQNKEYAELKIVETPNKSTAEYLIVPKSTCSLIVGTTLLDKTTFVSPLYGREVLSLRIE